MEQFRELEKLLQVEWRSHLNDKSDRVLNAIGEYEAAVHLMVEFCADRDFGAFVLTIKKYDFRAETLRTYFRDDDIAMKAIRLYTEGVSHMIALLDAKNAAAETSDVNKMD